MAAPVRLRQGRRAACLGWLVVAAAVGPAAAAAQEPAATALDFGAARQRLLQVSDALSAAEANAGAKQQLAEATRALRLPEISGELQRLELRKTLELPLGSLAPVAEEYGIQSPLVFIDQKWHTRPLVKATLPLYTGGQIPAAQSAARAAVAQADAERALQAQTLVPQLVQVYFGAQLAEQALAVRRDTREGLERHLHNAERLEQEGFATKAQRLQAVVARDQAEREYQKAVNDLASMRAALALLLRSDTAIAPITPLFVNRAPLQPLQTFRDTALDGHPQLTRLDALVEQAGQGVRVQQARLKPQIYAFGQYDLRRRDALLTEPDWVFGVGLRYTFLSGSGRDHQIAAAREQQLQAEAGLREARNRIEIGVTQAYNAADTARQQYLLLESSIVRAEENLRLQELAFREGQATSLDLIDARLALGGARIERAQAAYQFDFALAQLLEASGQAERYEDYLRTAEEVLIP
ncbi:MAG: transporter [Lysobacterales bacterium 69-70]|nr:TolC family protein [Xanthomonadaceae bacterium]ODU32478.1 MAG: transporter [Xanthomonadaceae bacterium SCN 69-320]ODV16334.1 MAG: transporter [Xanthomonadaceae bacterium SCN 69-25]OJY97544.1 MAG: transporter [Xanthomonadales bacterium 69-70]